MMSLLSAGGLFAVLGSASTAFFIVDSGGGALGRALATYEERLDHHTRFLQFDPPGHRIARVQALAVLVSIGLALLARSTAIASLSVAAALIPPALLWRLHAARVAALERQLDGWLLMLANALKATSSVGEAIASTSVLAPRPFSEEVDLVVKELRLGVPLDRALDGAASRIGSPLVSGALMTIVVARQTGGDLSTTLQSAAFALRETHRLEGVLRTKTAEGRGQVLVLALVPFFLLALILWLDPAWFDPMIIHAYGRGILLACAAAWVGSVLWAHHIAGTKL